MTNTVYKTIIFEKRDGIGLLTFNRPERLNAMSMELCQEVGNLLDELRRDYEIRVLIMQGAGRAFCAGLDLKDDPRLLADQSQMGYVQHCYHEVQQLSAENIIKMRRIPQPIIAAIRGPAAGTGFAWALASDVRIATDSARFSAAFIRMGLSGGDVGTSYFLPRLIGVSRASEYLLTGRFMDAKTAERFGLVAQLVSDDQLESAALELAHEMLQNSPFGLRLSKEIINVNIDAPSLESALHAENQTQTMASLTKDAMEAGTAFVEKRKPEYGDH
jgi:enoyl-CoA hydratase